MEGINYPSYEEHSSLVAKIQAIHQKNSTGSHIAGPAKNVRGRGRPRLSKSQVNNQPSVSNFFVLTNQIKKNKPREKTGERLESDKDPDDPDEVEVVDVALENPVTEEEANGDK